MTLSALRSCCVLGLPSSSRLSFGYPTTLSKALGFPAYWSRDLPPASAILKAYFQKTSFSTTNQREALEILQRSPAHSTGIEYFRPHPQILPPASSVFLLSVVFRRHFATRNPKRAEQSRIAQSSIFLFFSSRALFSSYISSHWCVPGLKTFSSSSINMASSGKVDLNSPSTSWKEAKNFLKSLNSKQRREYYGVKDYVKLKEVPTWKDTAKKLKVKQPEEVKYSKNKDLNEKISIFRGDITKLEVDAIVNTANSTLLGGGGVDGCIHRAAGPLLKLECSSLGGCATGQAKLTSGYSLPAKWVIHTVGPVAQGQPGASQEEELKNCYSNSMKVAAEGKCRTVAFPCISTGVFGYPSEAAADVALGTLRTYLEENKDKFDRVIICVFLEKDEEIYLKRMPEYFPLA